jgi:LysM repeat protein
MRKIGLLIAVFVVVLLLALPTAASAETAQTAGGSGCAQFYRIKCGDTLSKIARNFGTSVNYLAWLNGIANPNHIIAGTTICVRAKQPHPPAPPPCPPGPKPPPPPPPPHHGGFYYTVRLGDTLGNIGARYGWSAWYLAQINGIPNPNIIYAGQVLWIPGH